MGADDERRYMAGLYVLLRLSIPESTGDEYDDGELMLMQNAQCQMRINEKG
jgi:hypothetical protein